MTDTTAKATPEKSGGDPEMKGWLLKWTNYIKGYQRRWFVLSKGVLSYYRNQSEISHTCRGTISLHGALIHTVDSCTFVISNGGTQTFHIKASNEVERQSWVTALELAKAKAIRAIESEDEEVKETAQVVPSQEINSVVRDLSERLENLRTCYDLITKHGVALQRALYDLESNDEEALANRTKIVNERATLFRITANAMINACNDYLRTAESQGHKWSKMLQHEREQRKRLEDMIEQLAKQQSQMEQAAKMANQNKSIPPIVSSSTTMSLIGASQSVTSDDETEFYDAEENGYAAGNGGNDSPQENDNGTFVMKLSKRRTSSDELVQTGSSSENEEQRLISKVNNMPQLFVHTNATLGRMVSGAQEDEGTRKSNISRGTRGDAPVRKRRTRVPDKPNRPLNLWSVMKNCIGKDLSKIPMPVNFNEPLSMLQRLVEDYEYSEILDQASDLSDICEQVAYVAAFSVTSYAATTVRTGKPFNPLLGETYECDRMDDYGWRAIAEQVSHHPPIAAVHCESTDWVCWQEFSMTSKFRGKYVQVNPMGKSFVHFTKSGNKFSWHKVTTIVNNIIVGKIWVDHQGDCELNGLSASKGYRCLLKFVPYSYFSRETQRRVKGVVIDPKDVVKWVVRGTWDEFIEIAPVLGKPTGPADNPVYNTGDFKTVWKRRPLPPDSEKFYFFSEFAAQLNEEEEGAAPTDSRFRPDQRLMENAQWDESNAEKLRLEGKQRQSRLSRESEAEEAAAEGREYPPYEPLWFKREHMEDCDEYAHIYQGKYWECKAMEDWSDCPDIF